MDFICFCHIRWNFVYQRPQHLLNRFAMYNRVFIIEEPVFDTESNYFTIDKPNEAVNLSVVVLHVSKNTSLEKRNQVLKELLDACMYAHKIKKYLLWYYSPMALSYSHHLYPEITIYDCMDELSAFKFAPPELKQMETRLLSRADLVFTGGYSLYEAKKMFHHNIHPFPSSIDKAHFFKARNPIKDPDDQKSIPHPRFGFYGVIDERFHIALIDELSSLCPDWHFVLIGPVIKINPDSLPRKNNLHYIGGKQYNELPSYLSGWDIAILPFELNEATRYISPTKTPEYLAGGKPVISTSIADVVTPYGKQGLVHIADTAEQFIRVAKKIFNDKDRTLWNKNVDDFLANISWNKTWGKMQALIEETLKEKLTVTKKSNVYV